MSVCMHMCMHEVQEVLRRCSTILGGTAKLGLISLIRTWRQDNLLFLTASVHLKFQILSSNLCGFFARDCGASPEGMRNDCSCPPNQAVRQSDLYMRCISRSLCKVFGAQTCSAHVYSSVVRCRTARVGDGSFSLEI